MSDLSLAPGMRAHQDEQEWNRRKLSSAVTCPEYRLWAYHEPAVILGCSQSKLILGEPSSSPAGIDLLQRQTGGGAVLVGPWMLSASILLPCSHALVCDSAVQSYRWLGELFVSVLGDAGISAEAITPEQARESQHQNRGNQLGWACYGGLSPWEVVVGEKKIVGLAQVRRRTGILLVAGLLLDRPDWQLLCRAMDKQAGDADMLDRQTTSCAEQLGRALPMTAIADPLQRSLRNAIDMN